jgi:DNA-3-methyladenine glycosylase II
LGPVTILIRSDRELAQLIRFFGPTGQPILTEGYASDYEALVRAIISQQISTSAARAITARLLQNLGDGGITPESVSLLTETGLRFLGMSKAKAGYILGLAHSLLNGDVDLLHVHRLGDEEAVVSLQTIKGVGRWTAQMFAITQMGRPDIFPVGDAGIKSAMIKLYRLSPQVPDSELVTLANNWKPYRTLACLFLWKGLDGGYFQ